jgi:hypothetical protein
MSILFFIFYPKAAQAFYCVKLITVLIETISLFYGTYILKFYYLWLRGILQIALVLFFFQRWEYG